MGFVTRFISEYGTTILYGIFTALAGALGIWVKKIYNEYVNDRTKEKIVKVCVSAAEQLYKDLHGEEKYNKVVQSVVDMLDEKDIAISGIELKMLIEAAVAEFNNAFNKTENIPK